MDSLCLSILLLLLLEATLKSFDLINGFIPLLLIVSAEMPVKPDSL